MDPQDKNFDHSMFHLVELLKKLISQIPFRNQKEASQFQSKDPNVTMNFCFFNFLPMSPEDMDELEEIYESFMKDPEELAGEMKSELTSADLEFLRRNGIRY